MKLLTIQNLKNGKKIQVTDEQWNVIKAKGWTDRYKLLSEVEVTNSENIPAILAKSNGNKVTVGSEEPAVARPVDMKEKTGKVSGAPIPEKLPTSGEVKPAE